MTYVDLLYDAIGNYSGRAKVRAVAVVSQLEGDLSGHFITEVFDQNDDQVNSASGRIEARRSRRRGDAAGAPGEGRLPPAPVRAERGPKVWAEGARVRAAQIAFTRARSSWRRARVAD